MSTRLEEIQAAVRAKQQAGQKVFDTPIFAAPTVTGTVTPPPTTSTIGPGVTPTPTANYTSGTMKSTYSPPPTAPTTNYGGTGSALNEILYSKKQYDAGNKGWAAQNAQQFYSKLDPSESAAVSKMNTQQLTDYINSKNQPAANSGANTGGDISGPVPNIPNYGMNTGFVPAAPAQAPDYTNIMDTIRNNYMSDIKSQSLSIQQALDKAIAASQLNVNQNNNQLQEQIKALTNQKAQLDDSAQQLQNRRGGFYSGGLDYQLGNIASSTQQATSNAQRDVATRNDSIYANNAQLAQQAADTIKQLETAAPDKIRELIRQAINDERSFGLQEGQLTGSYNGNPTLAAQQFQWGQQVDSANLTGQFNGRQTLAGQQQAWNQQQDTINNNAQFGGMYNGNKTVQQQQQEWQNRFNYGQTIGQFPNGQQTLDAKNQAFNQQFQREQFAYQKARDVIGDQQLQRKFDEDVRQYGLNYGLSQLSQQDDQAYRQAQLALSQDDNSRSWAQLDYQQSQNSPSKYNGMTATQLLSNIKSLYQEPIYTTNVRGQQEPTGKTQLTTDPAKRNEMFLSVVDAGLSDTETKQVLLSLGYSMKDIEGKIKQYSGN